MIKSEDIIKFTLPEEDYSGIVLNPKRAKRRDGWDKEQNDILRSYEAKGTYHGSKSVSFKIQQELKEKLDRDRSVHSIQQQLFKLGINVRKQKFDKFKIIDSDKAAYWVGMLAADGCVHFGDNCQGSIGLSNTCEQTVKNFKEWTGVDNEILHHDEAPKEIRGRKFISKEKWSFSFENSEAALDLTNVGCGPSKSFTHEFPTKKQIPHNLLASHTRGYFDGDGSIYWVAKDVSPCWIVSTIGATPYIKGLQKTLEQMFGGNFKSHLSWDKRPTEPMPSLRIRENKSLLQFLEWMYKNSTEKTRMSRKYKLSMRAIKWLKERV